MGESLKDFVDRFNQQKLRVYDLDEIVTIVAFCSGVQHVKCAASFHNKRPTTLVELSERVGKYIDTEEFLKTKDLGAIEDGQPGPSGSRMIPTRDQGKSKNRTNRGVARIRSLWPLLHYSNQSKRL